ncbi:MAG TPA: 2Fe-2S iron-sulfur cluster-binding protein [Bacteroidales bacterium]|nr:2Fe-2S iron-sulfur cluster-binding protein [Bacteroidales bacterium]
MILLTSQTTVILLSITVFLTIILALVLVLLLARKKLTPQGKVKLTINDEKEIEVSPGNTILSTLSNNGVYLPSACGGGGTCGLCKCQVLDGGGSILPTETGFFTRKEQQNYWRLGCQVKIRNDMKIQVPEEVMGIKKWECEVVSNRNVATFIKEFVVKLPEGEILDFKSGGYVQIDVPKIEVDFKDINVDERFRTDWDQFNMWNLKMKNPEETFQPRYFPHRSKLLQTMRARRGPAQKSVGAPPSSLRRSTKASSSSRMAGSMGGGW